MTSTSDTPRTDARLPKSMKVGDTTYFIDAVLRQLDREVSEAYGFADPQKNTRRMVENLFRALASREAELRECVELLKRCAFYVRGDDPVFGAEIDALLARLKESKTL